MMHLAQCQTAFRGMIIRSFQLECVTDIVFCQTHLHPILAKSPLTIVSYPLLKPPLAHERNRPLPGKPVVDSVSHNYRHGYNHITMVHTEAARTYFPSLHLVQVPIPLFNTH